MARLFDDAQNEYLEIDQAVVTGVPLTLACWFKSDSITLSQYLIYIADKDVATHAFALSASGAAGGDPIRAVTYGGTLTSAASTAGYNANTWHHACGVFAATNSRAAYLDGGNKGTGNVDKIPANLDRTSIARAGDSTPGFYVSGYVTEAAIWNAVLTDEEVAILAKGFSPLLIHPQNLVAYWPLIRDEDQDRVGGYDLTAFSDGAGPGIATHIPIIYPAPRQTSRGMPAYIPRRPAAYSAPTIY